MGTSPEAPKHPRKQAGSNAATASEGQRRRAAKAVLFHFTGTHCALIAARIANKTLLIVYPLRQRLERQRVARLRNPSNMASLHAVHDLLLTTPHRLERRYFRPHPGISSTGVQKPNRSANLSGSC